MGSMLSTHDGVDSRKVDAETTVGIEKYYINDIDAETCIIDVKAGKTTIASPDLENKDNPEGIVQCLMIQSQMN